MRRRVNRRTQPQHEIRGFHAVQGAADADLFDEPASLVQARRIDEGDGAAVEIEVHLDRVARGSGHGGHDGRLAPRQCIEQGRFPGVRRSGDHHLHAFAHALRRAGLRQFATERAAHRIEARSQSRRQRSLELDFFGEVDGGFDQRRRVEESGTPWAGRLAHRSRELPLRMTALPLGFGVDEIGQPFQLRQVHLAVGKGAAREFARLGRTQPGLGRERGEHRSDHGRAAVQLEFDGVLADLAARGLEKQHDGMVQRRAVLSDRAGGRRWPAAPRAPCR